MPSIETIARPRRNRISVAVPKEYGSYSFQVILVPIATDDACTLRSTTRQKTGRKGFVDALLSSPSLGEGEVLTEDRRAWNVPSAFERAGCFDSEDFA